ncbi:armadillo-type protein [Mycena rosella]|uniref:Armadillo-type protein n=1 Tax=Mycena rosella TaxID=1033263 RepID=A0AAD7D9U7_MYCRO|nr:armadillo-type protein [Mycena rosella]
MCCLLAHIAASGGAQLLIDVYTSPVLVALLKHPESAIYSKSLQVLAEISDASENIGPCADVYTDALPTLVMFLQSPEAEAVKWTCRILGNIAVHETLLAATLNADPCVPLVSLLSQANRRLDGLYALHHISSSEIGACTVIYADAIPILSTLLNPGHNGDYLQLTCNVLANIASHRNLVQTILDANVCTPLLSLLSHSESGVQYAAAHALRRISCRSTGARIVVDLGALPVLQDLLQSTDLQLIITICQVIGNIARGRPLRRALLQTSLCAHLASLLSHPEEAVKLSALVPLDCLSRTQHGILAIVDAHAISALIELMRSSDVQVLHAISKVLSNMASENGLSQADLPLAHLLRHAEPAVYVSALNLLFHICLSNTGIPGATGAIYSAVALLQRELKTLNTRNLAKGCRILGISIGHDESRSQETIEVSLSGCVILVSLLRHSSTRVHYAAAGALLEISSRSERGARYIVNANAVPDLIQLLHSADTDASAHIHIPEILGRIVSYRILVQTTIDVDAASRLAELLRHPMFAVRGLAAKILHQTAENSGIGLHAVIKANMLPNLVDMLQSQKEELRTCTCELLGAISWLDERSREDIVDAGACYSLCQLLRDASLAVRLAAISALCKISKSANGAHAIVKANELSALGERLQALDKAILPSVCEVVGNITLQDDLPLDLIDRGICAVLMPLLRREDDSADCNAPNRLTVQLSGVPRSLAGAPPKLMQMQYLY